MKSTELQKELQQFPEYLTKHYKLRPCPFCYGKPEIIWDYKAKNAETSCWATVECRNGDTNLPIFRAKNEGNVYLEQRGHGYERYQIFTNTNPVEVAVKMWNGELDR